MPQNHYKMLGISQSANLDEIKQAVHSQSKEIKLAFAVLSDAEKRRAYDTKLSFKQHNHYKTLAVSQTASSAEIKDAAQFKLNELKAIYQVLSNSATRKAYDKRLQPAKLSVPPSPPVPSQSKVENLALQQEPPLPLEQDEPQNSAPQPLPPMRKHCSTCNAVIHLKAEICPECKTTQPMPTSERDKFQGSPYQPPASSPSMHSYVSETDLADRDTRLFARIVDTLALGVVPLLFGVFLGKLISSRTDTIASLAVFGYICITIINIVLLYRYGQTLGKRLLSIKIRNKNGDRAGLLRLLLVREWFMQLLFAIPVIGIIIAILNPLLIFRESRHCLHDTIAGTVVVKTDSNDTAYGSLTGAIGAVTLIMIVPLFVIFAIAIPAYTDYLRKGKVTEAVMSLINLRKPAEAYMAANNGEFPPKDAGLSIHNTSGTYTANITSNPNEFYFEATMSDEDDAFLDGLTVRFIYDPDTESWRCSANHVYGIPQKYLPEVCKK